MNRPLALLLAASLLGACGRSPEPNFHALFPQRDDGVVSQAPLSIEIRQTTLPAYLDRPQLVRRGRAGRVELDEGAHWAGPLDDLVTTTLTENLAQRLPNAKVFGERSSISHSADVRLEIALSRFELGRDGQVTLSALVAQRWRDAPARARLDRHELWAKPHGTGSAAVVQQMSGLLARLASAIAMDLDPADGIDGEPRERPHQ
jgi:uncharacterized lipoprotein YmbA